MNNDRTVIKHFEWYYDKGYITARDGNAAYRDGNSNYFWVTGSLAEKHKLQPSDFVMVDSESKLMNLATGFKRKPSIETGAHVAALRQSKKNASVHVHSPNTVALAALFEPFGGFKPQSGHLVKVLNTKWPELFRYTKVGGIVPFLDPGSKKLHDCIVSSLGYWTDEYIFDAEGEPVEVQEVKKWKDICIMERHGVLAIGDTLDECMEHIVRLEHISTILLKIVTASGSLESIL